MTPRLARWLVIAAAAVAVLVAATGPGERTEAAPAELELRYVYSTDAAKLLQPLLDQFNAESHRIAGREIELRGTSLASGAAEAAIESGDERAVLWTPASSFWGSLLNHRVSQAWVPPGSPPLVWSTQVIAMWRPLAEALGWPSSPIRWSDVLALATGKRTWADYGHEDFGTFLLGHTNPRFSTSGLSAVASHYYIATGKRSGLSLSDVQRREVRSAVRAIERSVVHQGETASNLIGKMLHNGPGYAHAVYVQETTLRGLPPAQAARLAPIKPADGTFVTDYPLIVLAAPWVGAEARAAAEVFRGWLRARITAENAAENGFDAQRPTGLAELETPKPAVLAAIQDAWHEDRKPANIVLVVDTSKSMGESGRLGAAKQALLSFLSDLAPKDRIAVVTSGATIQEKVPLSELGKTRGPVTRAVNELFPNGDQPVYPAVQRALESLRARNDPSRINALVVLSDGAGKSVGKEELLRAIEKEPVTEGTSVRIFTVAFGPPADAGALQRIASSSGGVFFRGGLDDIKGVYRRILSYF